MQHSEVPMRNFCLVAAVLCASTVARADAGALLDKAEASIKDLEYGEALKSIEAAKKETGNSREVMVRLYELQGIALATMGQEAKALKAFQSLLSLTADYRLKGNQPPRVTTVFFEARSWVDSKKPLAARGAGATMGPGVVKDVKVELTTDPLKLVKKVRFHLTLDANKSKDVEVLVSGTTVAGAVGAPRVQWWAELLGEKDAVLLDVGEANKLFSEKSPDAVAETPPVPVKPKEELKPPPKVDPVVTAPPPDKKDPVEIDAWTEPPPPSKPMSGLRLAGIGVGAGGVVAAGLGVVFGVVANGTAAKITGAEKDASGRIIGITRVDALALDAQQRGQATAANVLLIGGAVMVAGGVTMFLLGGASSSEPKVVVVPTLGGVGLTGEF